MPQKYSKEKRNEIGKRIFDGELTVYEAAAEYNVNFYTARDYFRAYKATLMEKTLMASGRDGPRVTPAEIKRYETFTRDQLIEEIIKERVENERLKKGYRLKGGGRRLDFEILESRR